MKLRKAGIGMVVIGYLLASPWVYGKEAAFSPSRSLAEILPSVKTPEALVKVLKKEFKYADDHRLLGHVDYWQSPEEFWNRKAGDCEDFALFAQYVLEKQGFETQVVSLYGMRGEGHTVAIFKREGQYHIINEDRLSPYRAESLEKALTSINPYWTWASVAERRNGRGWSLREIRNPTPMLILPTDPFSEEPF